MKKIIFAFLFAGIAVGCSEQPNTVNNNHIAVKEAVYFYSIPPNTRVASPEEKKEMRRIKAQAHVVVMSNESHGKAHEKLKPLLNQAENLQEVWSFEQSLAMKMLDQRLLKSETLTPSELSILGFYTDLLLKWKNPDASLIQPALAKLSGTWSKEKLQEAENMAISSANEWMQKQGTPICKDCSSNEKNLDQSKLRQISSSLQIMKRAE